MFQNISIEETSRGDMGVKEGKPTRYHRLSFVTVILGLHSVVM